MSSRVRLNLEIPLHYDTGSYMNQNPPSQHTTWLEHGTLMTSSKCSLCPPLFLVQNVRLSSGRTVAERQYQCAEIKRLESRHCTLHFHLSLRVQSSHSTLDFSTAPPWRRRQAPPSPKYRCRCRSPASSRPRQPLPATRGTCRSTAYNTQHRHSSRYDAYGCPPNAAVCGHR